MRDGPCTRLVHAVMGARNPVKGSSATPLLNHWDVAILLDAGFKGNKTRLLQPWKQGVQDLKKRCARAKRCRRRNGDV